MLELDNRSPYDKKDVYNILLQSVQNSQLYRWTELREVMYGIYPDNCWKYGYFTKGNCNWIKDTSNLPEYDMTTAFVYYVMSNLRFIENENGFHRCQK
jgi:hypothetical protein